MSKNAYIRFENANVAYVSVDTDTHELTGGVMDETTGIFHPVGGGGIANPVCTLTVIHSFEGAQQIGDGLHTMQNNIICTEQINAPTGTSTFDLVLIPGYVEGTMDYETFLIDTNFVTAVASDLVNCTYEDGFLYITDPTENCSLTLTLS